MKSPARMHKTLVSLAVAMTATAVSLHWMDPSAQAGRNPASVEELETLSKNAIGAAAKIKLGHWREIEISTDEELVDGGLALTASRDQRRCHFFIDAAGRTSSDPEWADQRAWPDTPNTVRIHLERASAEGPSSVQWLAARSLILALDIALSAKGRIPIHSDIFEPETVIYSSNL